jgi:hypothetical protein
MFRAKFLPAVIAAAVVTVAPMGVGRADDRQSLEELRNTVINLLQALVDQGVISKEKAAQMVKSAQDKAASTAAASAATAKSEEGAVRVPYVPQIVQDDIAKQVAEQVTPEVVAGVVQQAKTEGWGVPGALADWLKRTRVSGDVLLRSEAILYPSDNIPNASDPVPRYLNYYGINQGGGIAKAGQNAYLDTTTDRERLRARARLAVESDITPSITAGVRLATGNTSDLVSETQTLDGTAPFQFGVDELFIRLDERDVMNFPWLSVVGGRFLNPYGTPTNLIFHKDLTFSGFAVTGRYGFGDGDADQSHMFFTLGAHPLQEIQLSTQDKWLVAAQLGTNINFDDGQHLRIAGAFYDYSNVTGRLNDPGTTTFNYTAPQFMRWGNTYFDIANPSPPDITVNLFALAAKYRLANLNASYELPVGDYVFGLNLDVVRNLAFDSTDVSNKVGHYVSARTKGYQIEASFGTPTVMELNQFHALIGYRYLQRDAVIDAYTDSDFHYFGGTDATGYYLIGDYGVAHNVWLRFRYLSSNAIDNPGFAVDVVQLDVNTRF